VHALSLLPEPAATNPVMLPIMAHGVCYACTTQEAASLVDQSQASLQLEVNQLLVIVQSLLFIECGRCSAHASSASNSCYSLAHLSSQRLCNSWVVDQKHGYTIAQLQVLVALLVIGRLDNVQVPHDDAGGLLLLLLLQYCRYNMPALLLCSVVTVITLTLTDTTRYLCRLSNKHSKSTPVRDN
jgi:hypothetical protein